MPRNILINNSKLSTMIKFSTIKDIRKKDIRKIVLGNDQTLLVITAIGLQVSGIEKAH
jgi:hypothetical protein